MASRHYRVTLSDALEAHARALEDGGLAGITSVDLIESALARPYHGYYRKIWQKAAALLDGVVSNHGFADGNKRTALLVTLLFIDRSGYDLNLRPGERIDDMVVDVAANRMDLGLLEVWFKERLFIR